jgi:toxin ParE1/3/4
MEYKIIVATRTQKEYEAAIDYYTLYSVNAPINFIKSIQNAYNTLSKNPLVFTTRYKNIRAVKIKQFPYLLYFIVNPELKTVNILACLHLKRNTNNRP